MKVIKFILAFLSVFTSSLCPAQEVDLEAALTQLDQVVANRDVYIQNHQREIDQLKKALRTSTFDNDRYSICRRLFDEYQKFEPDSALYYTKLCQKLAINLGQQDLIEQTKIDELSLSIFRGQYFLAKSLLSECGPIENIHPTLQAKYATAILEYYMRIQSFKLGNKTDPYSVNPKLCWDKFCKYLPKNTWTYDYYYAMLLNKDVSVKMKERLKSTLQPSILAAMICVTIARSYQYNGNTKLYYYYLIQSAINDISMANREAQSLLYLIESPYVRRDSRRAFEYAMTCSENAKAYKDMGRSLDIVKAHAIITKSFEKELERKATFMIVIIVLLALSLIVIFIEMRLIISKRRNQAVMLTQVEDMNTKLNKLVKEGDAMRQTLKENNKNLQEEIKLRNHNFMNVYLMVSSYISDMQKYRKGVYNMLIAGKIDNAKKSLNSSTTIDEYLQDFYKHFDNAFMELHPDFIERFNQLLKPDKRITLAGPTVLSPELRIYALVSLGITDSVSIADFLHYSPQTIYNYRLKMRHNSCIEEKDFADTVANMYLYL